MTTIPAGATGRGWACIVIIWDMPGSNRCSPFASIPPVILATGCERPQSRPWGFERRGEHHQQPKAWRSLARLTRYLLKLFGAEAMTLFVVAGFLLFLIQCLRLFDLVA